MISERRAEQHQQNGVESACNEADNDIVRQAAETADGPSEPQPQQTRATADARCAIKWPVADELIAAPRILPSLRPRKAEQTRPTHWPVLFRIRGQHPRTGAVCRCQMQKKRKAPDEQQDRPTSCITTSSPHRTRSARRHCHQPPGKHEQTDSHRHARDAVQNRQQHRYGPAIDREMG